MNISYKDSGVDIDAGNEFVRAIKPLVQSTKTKYTLGSIGGFAGGFALPSGYKEPILFGATDGVGTKLRLAIDSGKLDTVGIDLVAMCVNDLITSFAEPLFFLDYYACEKLKINEAKEVVSGIAAGCKMSDCALIGGETAEMPGMYKTGDFDLAGFAVGIAEKSETNKPKEIKPKDLLIALPSSGLHSNGFSLARKVFFEKLKMNFNDEINGVKLIDILLKPTKIYVQEYKQIKPLIKGLAHITGGGIIENLPRIFGNNLGAKIDKTKIQTQDVFEILKEHVNSDEMLRTFNLGVGMIVVCDEKNAQSVVEKTKGYVLGQITNQSGVAI